jgi:hypothetical protein
MKYTVEMGSGAVPSFIRIGSGIQKLIGVIPRYVDMMEITQSYFHFFKIRKLG